MYDGEQEQENKKNKEIVFSRKNKVQKKMNHKEQEQHNKRKYSVVVRRCTMSYTRPNPSLPCEKLG